MNPTSRNAGRSLHYEGDETREFPWLILALTASSLALFFQVFPGLWWSLLAVFDVRGWTWRSYAVLCALALGYLIYMKVATESD